MFVLAAIRLVAIQENLQLQRQFSRLRAKVLPTINARETAVLGENSCEVHVNWTFYS
jgi:hypothetical protein